MSTENLPLFNSIPVPVSNARRTDPVTSQIAAEANKKLRERDAWKALEAHYKHRDRGLDDFELSEITGTKQTSIGKRRGDLVKLGFVESTGVRRESPSRLTNSVVMVWKVTGAGVAYYEAKRETAENRR